MSVYTIQLSFPACFWLCYLLLQPWPGSKESGTDETEFNPCRLVSRSSSQKEAGSKWMPILQPWGPYYWFMPHLDKRCHLSVMVGVLTGEEKSNSPLLLLMIPAKLAVNTSSRSLSALIDSGAEQSFIDHSLAFFFRNSAWTSRTFCNSLSLIKYTL